MTIKYIKLSLTFVFAFILSLVFYAQENFLHCGTSEAVKQSLEKHPQLKYGFDEEQFRLKQLDEEAYKTSYSENNKKQLPPVYIIPIVFHILHIYGVENISDAQVIDEIRVLNEDYRKLNASFANTISSFQSIAADCQIEFRLAQKDPNGNCTNGIDRIYSTLTNTGDDNAKLNYWDRSKYLNVWVVKTMADAGVAAYAYYPGTAFDPTVDGVIMSYLYVGAIGTSNESRSHVLTHEIGHFLNLQHVWGNTNNPGVACGDDAVSDTPITMGHTSCALNDATCTSGIIENVQNYMDYSYCYTMFTAGQKTRMRNALNNNSGQRNSLITSSNLLATGVSSTAILCQADFTSSSISNILCQGDSITFSDLSWNGNVTNWNWSFPGGTPSTSTDSVPSIHYNTPGVFNVSLIVSNATGTRSATKTNYITVNSTSAMNTNSFYSEDFEGSNIPNANWRINNILPGGNTWIQTNVASASGSKSMMMTNQTTDDSQIDELLGPSYDISTISGSTITMTFKTAYAQRLSTSLDKLQMFVSINCGKSWNLRKTVTGAALGSGIIQTNPYFPTPSQWIAQSASLTGYSSAQNLYIMFRFTSNGGNNVFLDDINITGTFTNIEEEIINSLNFTVFPNPNEGDASISFDLIQSQNVDLKISDVLGKEITKLANSNLSAGEYHYSVGKNGTLSSGIYIVSLSVGDQHFTKKLIVN